MKILKRIIIGLVAVLVVFIILYLIGPKIQPPNFAQNLPEIPADIISLESWLADKESLQKDIKPNNQAQIVWGNEELYQTEYALVYLHGFGASHQEGFPVHRQLADSLQANLFLARQKGHGLSSQEAFKGLTAESYMLSAMEALAIGQQLGEKIILVGTSTGAAQAIWLAAEFPEAVDALILYSPYIALRDASNEKLVLGPWGANIMELVMGGDINHEVRPDSVAAFWSEYYHLDSYFSLFSMINKSMKPEIFEKVNCPVFMAYYYKDEDNQDDVVSVSAMQQMFAQLKTPTKKAIAFPKSGNHVIASDLRSKDWEGVRDSSWMFIKHKVLQAE
ncbi:Alpha/beta hydrolase family protein [Marivirga sericea]|uniref:Alpha/beta hydrolase family protein n=1 Tax=Marivirga sericea TaxID=1028 RepID=A0A1X7IK92_9BACT|nr:alpha/beta hydrolase [Marivirga sericea]SMG15348.1 Alpha/beta hydrolase family protein [Marivirga sericea]